MKTVTMVAFRNDTKSVLRRVAKGERFVLTHRGKPAARLEPVQPAGKVSTEDDPFLNVRRRATASPKGNTRHVDIDRIVYGR